MSLAAVVDEMADRLGSRLGAGVGVSDRRPAAVDDLPHVTVSVVDADRPHIGVGGMLRAPEVGALAIQARIDLADPVIMAGGETVVLVDASRRTVVLPNGPLVTADGSENGPFTGTDLSVVDPDGVYEVVAGEPSGRQVRPEPAAGTLHLGQPLPAAGDLVVDYHVGVWEVEGLRYVGHLEIEVTAANGPELSTLARQVADALGDVGGSFERLVPTAWQAAEPGLLGTDLDVVRHKHQLLFAFDREQPIVPTSGGIVRVVDVTAPIDGDSEHFTVPVGDAVP